MAFSSVSQHARELETRRREAEERERRKQREVQMELERQLKEAEMVKKSFPLDTNYVQSLFSLTLIFENCSKMLTVVIKFTPSL